MEERHRFLSEQLDDLRKTRADLMDIITEVDSRVEQVFAEAYADVEAAFGRVFSRLFPGGEGRLVLTEPGNWLTTGVDVEARPPGKKVKRLSLLSGGERSLVAVAFLVAAVHRPAQPVLHPGRGRGGAGRHQPRPAAGDLRGAPGEQPAAGDHPPEAHDGDRRRPVRRHDARRRRLHRDLPAAAGDRVGGLSETACRPAARRRLRRIVT